MKKILVPISNGTEEMEAVVIIDMLRRAGCEVTVAGDGDVVVCAWGTRILPDMMIDDIADDDVYDAIVLPGGTQGVNHFIANQHLEHIVKRHHKEGVLVGAICAAPLVLNDFNLLPQNAVVTSHPGVAETFAPYAYTLDRVATDGKIITSRGAGTAFEFALTLIRRLVDEKTSLRIASDIVMYE